MINTNPVLSFTFRLSAVLMLGLLSARAGENQPSSWPQLNPPVTNFNRVGLSYRMGFNMWANFRSLTPLTPGRNTTPVPQPNNGHTSFNYDNGYVYPNTSVVPPGSSFFYGYAAGTPVHGSQFDLYRSSVSAGFESRERSGDPQHGLELIYNRQLGAVNNGFWGLEIAGGFADITINDDRPLSAPVHRNRSTFATVLGGPQGAAPQFHADQIPSGETGWPSISTAAATQTDVFANGASITGSRSLDVDAYDLRLGLYLDLPISERFLFTLSGGPTVLFVHSDFSFDEQVAFNPAITISPLPAKPYRGADSTDQVLIGGYLSGMVAYALSDQWRIFAGATFQPTQNLTQTTRSQQATLELGKSVYVSFGLAYSF